MRYLSDGVDTLGNGLEVKLRSEFRGWGLAKQKNSGFRKNTKKRTSSVSFFHTPLFHTICSCLCDYGPTIVGHSPNIERLLEIFQNVLFDVDALHAIGTIGLENIYCFTPLIGQIIPTKRAGFQEMTDKKITNFSDEHGMKLDRDTHSLNGAHWILLRM